jgi:CubicO group peptidase (beta-lactamase class C family)
MKKTKSILFYIFIVVFLISGQESIAQNDEIFDEVEKVEQQIDNIFSEYNDVNKPGASIAVVKNGKIVFKKGYGSANLEYSIPTTPSTIFHIASVSKQFTVFSILLLEDQGKLTLDDDIREYIPEVPNFGNTITLRHLASHTSGLRDQFNLLEMAGWRLDDVITMEHILKLVVNQKELNFEPGEQYMYCNTGFTLLAEVVSRVSGKSFAEFTASRIFEPLEMSNTLFYDDHEIIVKNRSYSYHSDSTGYKKSVLSYANVGATGLFTTVEDLSLWVMNFSSPKAGNADLIKQMNTLATLNNGKTFGGAYGQFVSQYKGLNQIRHGGADAGYRSYLRRFPDQKLSVIVLSNYASASASDLSLRVANLFLKDQMVLTKPDSKNNEETFRKLKDKELEGFASNYWNDAGSYSIKIYVKNDTLMYFRGEGNESPLVPTSNKTFRMLNVKASKVKFECEDNGQTMIITKEDGNPIIYKSFVPANYSDEELKEFTGTFFSPELSTSYNFILNKGRLIARHSRLSDIKIYPFKQDMFLGNRSFFSKIKYERDNNNTITGIRVSGGRVKNVYFKKNSSQQ